MLGLKILNGREIRDVLELIGTQWGAEMKIGGALLQNNKSRIFLVNRDISKIDLSKLRINSIGMYFCEIEKGIRLSIEGSQLVGPKASKNMVEIDELQAKSWMKGEDLNIEGDYSGFVIIKNKNDFLGTGKYKDGIILNYVGKERRVSA